MKLFAQKVSAHRAGDKRFSSARGLRPAVLFSKNTQKDSPVIVHTFLNSSH